MIERLRRDGNVLNYDVTVEDPDVLLQTWTPAPWKLQLNTNPKAHIPEGEPCHDYDTENIVGKIHH